MKSFRNTGAFLAALSSGIQRKESLRRAEFPLHDCFKHPNLAGYQS